MSVFVTKADGSKQLYDRAKIIKTCLRMGATHRIAMEVADKIEDGMYQGISTKKILQMIARFMRKYKPGVRHFWDLRKGLSLMSSKPEFEIFVRAVLSHDGFDVGANRLLRGKCVEHEVDAIAKKHGKTYFVEAKHHLSYHALTGLDESRIARAVLEDVTEGFELGKTDIRIDGAMIVTNTKFSKQAKRYGKCRGLLQIGWSTPENQSLQNMIDKDQLYPLSCLKGLRIENRNKLVNSGIVLMKQLFEENPSELAKKAVLKEAIVRSAIEKAQAGLRAFKNS